MFFYQKRLGLHILTIQDGEKVSQYYLEERYM